MYERTPADDSYSPPAVYRAQHDPDGTARLSETIVHALAESMGVNVTDCDFSLYDSVDPDALNRLFRPREDGTPRTDGMLSFIIQGHRVTVHADGEILIEPPRSSP